MPILTEEIFSEEFLTQNTKSFGFAFEIMENENAIHCLSVSLRVATEYNI